MWLAPAHSRNCIAIPCWHSAVKAALLRRRIHQGIGLAQHEQDIVAGRLGSKSA